MRKKRRVLVVGSGGREVALYEAIGKSPTVERVFVAPGNSFIPHKDRLDVPYSAGKYGNLVMVALSRHIDLVVVGPDEAVVGGIWDTFQKHAPSMPVFAPSMSAARLEGSKLYCRSLCHKHGIPSPLFAAVDTENRMAAVWLIRNRGLRVVKADGLCNGKGVTVARTSAEALAVVDALLLHDVKGKAGRVVVLEEKLEGEELSVTALCDGVRAVMLPTARDYKRLRAGSEEMTGGMGAYSPVLGLKPQLLREIKRTIIDPLLGAMRAEGTPYHGVLYAGIMLTKEGPKLLEVNCRFGDPETQVLLPRLKRDIVPYLWAATNCGGLARMKPLTFQRNAAVCVCLASKEYPTSGHRLQSVVGVGSTLASARRRAYAQVEQVSDIANLQYRPDIAAEH